MDHSFLIGQNPKNKGSYQATDSREWHQILADLMMKSTTTFFHKANVTGAKNGLDLNCKTGETTFLLSQLLGENGKVLGLDKNSSDLKIAQQKLAAQPNQNIQFLERRFFSWEKVGEVDFVYSRQPLNQLDSPVRLFNQVFRKLTSGGFFMIEEIDFSNFNVHPPFYAYDQYAELNTALNLRQFGTTNIYQQITTLLQQANFSGIKIQNVLPTFLQGSQKKLASLHLESLSDKLSYYRLITPTKINTLITELKRIEKRQDTMISLPSIYQIWGYKK